MQSLPHWKRLSFSYLSPTWHLSSFLKQSLVADEQSRWDSAALPSRRCGTDQRFGAFAVTCCSCNQRVSDGVRECVWISALPWSNSCWDNDVWGVKQCDNGAASMLQTVCLSPVCTSTQRLAANLGCACVRVFVCVCDLFSCCCCCCYFRVCSMNEGYVCVSVHLFIWSK